MPYIKKADREYFTEILEVLQKEGIDEAATLNYLVTKICQIYLFESGECYKTYNEIIGVLECTKLEMYRRKVAPYEEKKLKSNGDI